MPSEGNHPYISEELAETLIAEKEGEKSKQTYEGLLLACAHSVCAEDTPRPGEGMSNQSRVAAINRLMNIDLSYDLLLHGWTFSSRPGGALHDLKPETKVAVLAAYALLVEVLIDIYEMAVKTAASAIHREIYKHCLGYYEYQKIRLTNMFNEADEEQREMDTHRVISECRH